jgi:hypothetical protein
MQEDNLFSALETFIQVSDDTISDDSFSSSINDPLEDSLNDPLDDSTQDNLIEDESIENLDENLVEDTVDIEKSKLTDENDVILVLILQKVQKILKTKKKLR